MTPSRARRRWLKQVAIAAGVTPGGVLGLIRNVLAKGNNPVPEGLHKFSGEVRVNDQPARAGMLIVAGDTIRTGPGAEAIYIIGQDAFLQRDNSIISFGTDGAQKLMRVVTGKILSVFGKGQRTVTVSTATIGIRGTGCYIEDEPVTPNAKVSPGWMASPSGTASTSGTAPAAGGKSRTYFCLCYGEVELVPSAAPNETTRYATTHHDHPLYIHDDMAMPTMMVPATVMNHSDAELTLLESLVGRRPPFFGQESRY